VAAFGGPASLRHICDRRTASTPMQPDSFETSLPGQWLRCSHLPLLISHCPRDDAGHLVGRRVLHHVPDPRYDLELTSVYLPVKFF
jgi:hypothetical protein